MKLPSSLLLVTACLLSSPLRAEESSAFAEAMERALAQNPRVLAVQEEWRASDARVDTSRSGYRPNVSASLDIGRQSARVNQNDRVYDDSRSRALSFTQPLSGFGTLSEIRAARARRESAAYRLDAVRQQTALEFASAWAEVSAAQSVLSLNEQNRAAMQRLLDATQIRLDAGDATITDLSQAQSRLALAETNHAVAQAGVQKAMETYQRVAGEMPAVTTLPPLPGSLPASLDEAEAMVYDAPENRQAEQDQEAADYDVDVRKAAFLPTFAVRGTVSDQWGIDSVSSYDRLREESLVLTVRMPLYQSGSEYSRLNEAKRLRARSQQQAGDTKRQTVERVRKAWHDYTAAQDIFSSADRASTAAQRALEGLNIEYEQGFRTLIDVLDAQGEMLTARVRRAQAEADIRRQAYTLAATTGRLAPKPDME